MFIALNADFEGACSTGPFKDEDKQIDPLVEQLVQWFPGQKNIAMINKVLTAGVLCLIVENIQQLPPAAARLFLNRQFMTTEEMKALSKTCR